MTCKSCGTDLICRMKDYGGNFASTLQWQNFDGSAHYSTTDGKNYSCKIPDDDTVEAPAPGQTQITPPATTPGNTPPSSVNLSIINSLDEIHLKLNRMDEMIQAIFRYTVDRQLAQE